VSVALLAADGRALAEHGTLRSLRDPGTYTNVSDAARIWLPAGEMAAMMRWYHGQYVREFPLITPAGPARLVIEQAAAPLVARIEDRRLNSLSLLAALMLVAVVLATLLSRWLTRSIQKLDVLSRDLSSRIASGVATAIPGSRVAEYDSLAASIRAMADSLSTSFRAVREMRDTLEQRVQARTAELQRREAMLAESEARFRNLADAAPALIWLSDTDNLGTWYNRRWLEYTGRSLQQELGLGWAEGVHPDDLDRCVAYCNAAFAERRPFEMEFRLRRADGTYGWIADTGIPRFDAAGEFEGYIGYCWDITDRKQAEFALRRQQRLGEVIVRAQSRFIRETDRHAAFDGLLADMLALTDSGYGFIGEVLQMPDGRRYLKTHAITDIAWDESSRALYAQQASQGMEFHNLDTLFGAVITGNEAVIANDPAHDPRRGGLPHGHPPLDAFLGVPIHSGDELVAMLGLANRPGGYDRTQIDFLRPLLVTIGQLIEALRSQRRYQDDQARLARLSRVASQTTNGVVITDTDGRVEWINEGFTRISGYTLDELRGRAPGSLLQGPDTDPATVARIGAALHRREPFVAELINYSKAGEPYWIRISCNPLLDVDGNLQGFMAIQSDVTEEKRAAERLRDSERRLSAVIEGTHIGTWEWNVQTGETVFNERWAEIVGYTLAELEPISIQTWVNLAHPDDLQHSNELLQRHFAGELEYYDIECRMRHKDGSWVWVHDRGRVVSWTADGKPLLMSGTHADISEQKQAEVSLRASEEQYRSLVVNIPGAAYQCAMDPDWTVLYISDAIEALTGYPAQEFIGNAVRSYASVIHPDDALLGNQTMHEAIAAGEPWAIEYRLCHRDGSVRWVYEKGQAIRGEHGEILWLSGFIHDITERKRMERMKDEFISTVSHELRTPLTSISGALGLLAGGAAGALSGPVAEMIGIAHKNSLRLTHLINDLLDMEKLVAGKLRFDLQVQELMPLVEQSLRDNQPYAAQYRVRFALAARCDGVQVRVDALRLQQVLANFLSNAAKFSPEGGSVEVAVTQRDAMARVEVIDHGPGIPVEFRPQIFEKFSQADASDARQRGGTGLGLAISKELIERMHGTVGFESEPGQGARFHFDLPVW
jgi:PAS domain S-box-containing protein